MIAAQRVKFPEFLTLSDRDLTTLQLKITYVGEQRKLLPSLIITGPGVLELKPEILSVTAANLDFGNDLIARSVLNASVEELHSVLNSLNALPPVRMGGGDAEFSGMMRDALLVLSLLHHGSDRRLELVIPLDPIDAELVLDALGKALHTNKDCRNHLSMLWRALGFHIGSLDPDTDGDGASDGREMSRGTDPTNPSSAGDGVLDGERIVASVDPLNVLQPEPPETLVAVDSGPFGGSRIVDATTAPEQTWGVVTVELSYVPEDFVTPADRLVFMQTFRRTGLKANGIRVPFAPSLYLVYAGSPELDQITIEGETVDHKVGELDPYYNGDDPHDIFSVVPDKQRPGSMGNGHQGPTRMLYRARTYEHHWRLLNPEGIAEVQFDYETAVFCDSGPAAGQFLGVVDWRWGKRRSGLINAAILAATSVQGPPNATVTVVGPNDSTAIDVYSQDAPGQPSVDYLKVLTLWNRHHKFALPGPLVRVDSGVAITVPQPVSTSVRIEVSQVEPPPTTQRLESLGLRVTGFARSLVAKGEDGVWLWDGFFPFALPLTVTFHYESDNVDGIDESRIGVGRLDQKSNEITSEGLNILSKNRSDRSITFTTERLGTFVVVGGGR